MALRSSLLVVATTVGLAAGGRFGSARRGKGRHLQGETVGLWPVEIGEISWLRAGR